MFGSIGSFFTNLGRNVGRGVRKAGDFIIPDGTNARTPGIVPESVGADVGSRMGGVLPTAEAPDFRITPKPLISPPAAPSTMRGIVGEVPNATGAPSSAPAEYTPPRLGERNIRAEVARRQSDPNPDVIYDEPYGREKVDYILRNGDPREAHRGWKAGFKDFFQGGQQAARNLPPGADVGQVLGAFLGGGAGSSIAGKVNPVALEEQNFEAEELPRLYRNQTIRNEQARAEADIGYKQAQAQADRDRAQRERDKLDWEMKQPIKTERGMMRQDETMIEGTAPLPTPRPPVSIGGNDYLWNPQTGKYDPVLTGGKPTPSTSVIVADKNIGSREKIAANTDKTRRETAVLAETGRANRHEDTQGRSDAKRQQEADMWFRALESALKNSNGKQDTPEIESALRELRKYPDLYETGIGQGEWPYAKPRQNAASQPQGQVDVEAYVKAAEANGKTRQQAMDYLRKLGHIK